MFLLQFYLVERRLVWSAPFRYPKPKTIRNHLKHAFHLTRPVTLGFKTFGKGPLGHQISRETVTRKKEWEQKSGAYAH